MSEPDLSDYPVVFDISPLSGEPGLKASDGGEFRWNLIYGDGIRRKYSVSIKITKGELTEIMGIIPKFL